MRAILFSILVLAGSVPQPVVAQTPDPSASASTETTRAPRRRASRSRAAGRVVATFPGFQMQADGSSRCFVHLSATVAASARLSGRRFEVTLPGTVVVVRNHLQPLETRYFDTPMLRAKLERRGRSGLALVVQLRSDVTPTMHVDPVAAGGVDVVIDFPAGHYVEGPPQIGGSVELSDSENAPTSQGTASVRLSESERAAQAPVPAAPAPARTTATTPSPASSTTASTPAPAARTTTSTSTSTSTSSGTTPAPSSASGSSSMTAAPAPTRMAPPPDDEDDDRPPIFGGRQ